MQYTAIGGQTNFCSFANSSPYGCGTYCMTFFLPKNSEGYALEIPEIFSAYTLYIDDDLILQMGEPVAGQSLIQNRTITLYGGEPVTLTIAVSNYDHFYGGIVYPPSFGTKHAVDTFHDLRLAVCLFGCTVAMIFALLSFYFSLRMKQKNTLLFALICLAMCGLSSYPIVHTLIAAPVFPLYALELFCFYLASWLIIILQNRICQPGFLPAVISNATGAVFCLYALGYGLMSSQLSLSAIRFFSAAVFCYKAACALYLLATAAAAIHQKPKHGRMIFYAATAAACAFAWDRLLPVYEPILGGWYAEWGNFFVVLAIGCSLWHDVVEGYGTGLIFQEERKQMLRQLSMQTEYTRQMSETAAQNRRFIHDIKQQLRTIDSMAAEHDQTEIRTFLSQVEKEVISAGTHSRGAFCQNPAVNALIQYYDSTARTQGIDFDVWLDFPDHMPLTDVELCTVLGNLLDNAKEACERQKEGLRHILIAGEIRGSMYFLKIENTYNGKILQKNGRFLSQKGDSPYHGIGLSSVRKIIETHAGSLDIVPRGNTFFVGIAIELER